MKVLLAGYNLDSSLVASLNSPTATPEVISAAYARISRSPKSVDALRREALAEIEKARSSNTKIIFEMGHASVAEHAVFNIDLIDISRHLTELVQHTRLASFTEKSQRYVTFGRNYAVPRELDAYPQLKSSYLEIMKQLFEEYEASYNLLDSHYQATYPHLKSRDREGMAKEDARYILPLATQTQMGMTINARSLESLLRRLAGSPLAEARQLHTELYQSVQPITPSLIRHIEPDGYSGSIDLEQAGYAEFLQQELPWVWELDQETRLRVVQQPSAPDDTILAGLIYQQGELKYTDNYDTVARMPESYKSRMWEQVFQNLKSWHKVPRAFELVDYGFEISMSESCWAQFKRHRLSTMLRKGSPGNLIKVPAAIKQIKRQGRWDILTEKAMAWSDKLPSELTMLAPYARLNASVMNVYVKMNLREIYHFVRLRCDAHAQWEIRQIASDMVKAVRKTAPYAARYLCGKSEFPGDEKCSK